MKKIVFFAALLLSSQLAWGQTVVGDIFSVKSTSEQNGLRFWDGDVSFRISFGQGSEFKYGPVTDYSIKTTMSGESGRGWTWGQAGQIPVAAITNTGVMQIKNNFTTEGTLNSWGSILQVGNFANGTISRVQMLLTANSGWMRTAFTSNARWDEPTARWVMDGNIGGNDAGAMIYTGGGWAFVAYGSTSATPRTPMTNSDFIQNGSKMFVAATGNVIVGTANQAMIDDPNHKFLVNGKIKAKGVKVDANGWADFVFDPNFKLRPLSEVATFIKENKHLPDVPSEQEVKENGIDVTEMQKIQMQKIEELYLYVIEMKKENEELKKQNQQLQKEVDKLNKKKR